MNKTAIAILSVVALVASVYFVHNQSSQEAEVEGIFADFMNKYRKSYNSEPEFAYRLKIFKQNLETAKYLQQINPEATFGVTPFADLTDEEMLKRMGDIESSIPLAEVHKSTLKSLPDHSIEWRHVFQPIQNQGSCGSCWAFAATATVEAYKSIKGEDEVKLSEQQLVDWVDQCEGCNGGLAITAFDYLKSNNFCTLASYPYTAKNGECKTQCTSVKGTNGSILLDSDEEKILTELDNGPIAVSVDASSWKTYTGGVISDGCGQNTNHAVVIVAFTNAGCFSSWTIRNSWGSSWGDNGHIHIKYGKNLCNIEKRPCLPKF